MACLINRNKDGKIVEVLTESGEKSKLFDAIHSNAFMADTETSAKVYANYYSDEVANLFEGADKKFLYDTNEPILFYQDSKGVDFNSVEEMLIETSTNSFKMGFKNPNTGEFMPIASLEIDKGDKNNFVRKSIEEGILSDKRVLMPDGTTKFQGKGEFIETRRTMARLAKMNAILEHGNGKAKVDYEGTIDLNFDTGMTTVLNKDGTTTSIRTEDIPSFLSEADPENKVDLITEYVFKHADPIPTYSKSDEIRTVNESTLLKNLNSFMSDLGFSTTTLEEYRRRYKTKYGQDPDIQAITDMANNVVAFAQGQATEKNMTEEVAHIAIEHYSDRESIESALLTVHLTDEYSEYSDYYREKYSPFYKGVELESQVRREVLGKILGNELLNRFSKDNKTPERQNIIDKIKEYWNSFVDFFRQRLTSRNIQDLEDLNDKIVGSIVDGNISDFEVGTLSENFYYSAQTKDGKEAHARLQVARAEIENLFKSSLNEPVPDQYKLDALSAELGENQLMTSLNAIVRITERQMKVLKANILEAEKTEGLLSKEDQYRFGAIQTVLPMMASIRTSLINSNALTKESKRVIEDTKGAIRDLSESMVTVDSKMTQFIDKNSDRILEGALENTDLTENQKQEVKTIANGTQRDISTIGKLFGLTPESRNPWLALAGKMVSDLHTKVRMAFVGRLNKDIEDISKNNLEKYQSKIVMGYYYMSPIKWSEYDKDLNNVENEIISDLTEHSKEEVAKLRKKQTEEAILGSQEKVKQFHKRVKDWEIEEGLEQRFNKKYREEKEKRYERAYISEATKETISNRNRAYMKRSQKYLDENGNIDHSKKTKGEEVQDQNLFAAHKAAKNPFDSGEVKPGLRVEKFDNLTQQERESLPFTIDLDYTGDVVLPEGEIKSLQDFKNLSDNLVEESRVALDLNNLDMVYREELKEKSKTSKPVEEFFNKIKEIEDTGESAYDWMISNSTITLNDNFFNSLDTGFKSYTDIVQEAINDIGDTDFKKSQQSVLDEIKDLQRARKYILKESRKASNPIETDAYGMGATRNKVRFLEGKIEDLKELIRVEIDYSQAESQSISKRSVNEDFEKMYIDSGVESVYKFSLDHMTDSKRLNVTSFAKAIDLYIKGKSWYMNRKYENFIQEMKSSGIISEAMTKEEIGQTLKDEYAKRNVASYFQRYEPEGYGQILEDMKSGKLSIYDFLKNREEIEKNYTGAEFLEIRPEYSWQNEVNQDDIKNSNYKNSEYYKQPRFDKYMNKEFFSRYGISVEDYKKLPDMDISKLEPTKNKEEYSLLVKMLKLREDSLEKQGDRESVNKFLRPQASRTTMEKISTSFGFKGKANLKDIARDIYQDRIDEKEHGELLNGEELVNKGSELNIKLIPKYFQQKLENPDILTNNVIQAALIDYKEALTYEQRKEMELDFNAVKLRVKNSDYSDSGFGKRNSKIGKKGEVSNFYKKMEEYLDFNLYGIKQSRRMSYSVMGKEVDLTRVLNSFSSWVRFTNLGYNFFVDATSLTTGALVNVSDRLSGEFYHKSSANRASTLSTKVFKYIGEEGKMNKASDMNHLLELFGVENPDQRIKNSGYGRGMRLLDSSPYLVSKISNMGIKPQALMSVLTDVRFIEGKFRGWNSYYNYRKSQDKTISSKQIEAEFKQKSKESLYDHLDVSKSGIKPNKKFSEKFENPQKEFETIVMNTSSKIERMIQTIDTVISPTARIAAQRDALTNTLMMHKGWLPVHLTKRFKKKQYNFNTGQVEEGHFQTLSKFLMSGIKNKGNFRKALRELKEEGDGRLDIVNLKRSMFETGILLAIILLGKAIFSMDDDDDTVMEDIGQYIYLRTSSEYNSASLFGITSSILDVVENPVTIIRTVKELEPVNAITGLYSFDAEEWGKFAKNTTPYKRLLQYSDIQKQVNSYWHFNKTTVPFSHPIKEEKKRLKKERDRKREEYSN